MISNNNIIYISSEDEDEDGNENENEDENANANANANNDDFPSNKGNRNIDTKFFLLSDICRKKNVDESKDEMRNLTENESESKNEEVNQRENKNEKQDVNEIENEVEIENEIKNEKEVENAEDDKNGRENEKKNKNEEEHINKNEEENINKNEENINKNEEENINKNEEESINKSEEENINKSEDVIYIDDENGSEYKNRNDDIICIDDEKENKSDDVISIDDESESNEIFSLNNKRLLYGNDSNYDFHIINKNLKEYSKKNVSSYFLNNVNDFNKNNDAKNNNIEAYNNENNVIRYINNNIEKINICLRNKLMKNKLTHHLTKNRPKVNYYGTKNTSSYKHSYFSKNNNIKNKYDKRREKELINIFNKEKENGKNKRGSFNKSREKNEVIKIKNKSNKIMNELRHNFSKNENLQKEINPINLNDNKKELFDGDEKESNNSTPKRNRTKRKNRKRKNKSKKDIDKDIWNKINKMHHKEWIYKEIRDKNISLSYNLQKINTLNKGIYDNFMSKTCNLIEILFKNKFVEMSFIDEKEKNIVNKYYLDFEALSLNNKDFLDEKQLKEFLLNRKEIDIDKLISHTVFSQSLSSAVIVDFENIRIGFKNRYGRNMEINDFFEIINNIIYLLNFKCNVVHIHATQCEEFLRCKYSKEDYAYHKDFFLKLEKIKEEAEKCDLELKIYYYFTKSHYISSNSIKQLGTDIEIGLDIQEMGYKNYVDCVILLSSDSDFFHISYKSLNCQFIHCSDRKKNYFDINDKLSPLNFIMKFGKPIIICCFKNDLTKSKLIRNEIIKVFSFNYLSLVYKALCSKCERYEMMKLYENIENKKHILIEKINNIKKRENNEVKESIDILLLDDFISYVNPLFLNGEKFNYSYFLSNQNCSCAYSLKEIERKINVRLN